MSITYTFNRAQRSDVGAGPISGSGTEVGNQEHVIDTTLAAGASNVLVSYAFTVASIQGFLIVADMDCTLLTNSTSAPGNTFNLKAGRALSWERSPGYYPDPFTVDVTALYFSSVTAGRVRGHILTT